MIDVNLEQSQQRERELERERARELERQKAKERERLHKERFVIAQASRELAAIEAEPIESDSSENENVASTPMEISVNNNQNNNNHTEDNLSSRGGSESRDSFDHHSARSVSNVRSPNNNSNSGMSSIGGAKEGEKPAIQGPLISLNLSANAKKKKLEVKDVFNMEDENEESNGPKKRKLVPLGEFEKGYSERQKQRIYCS